MDFTCEITCINDFSQFLDIKFKFDHGKLTTDLYRKPTDANRYLEFTSSHPRHTFSSVVYSQGIRYRRIINDDELLSFRLNELENFFINSSYPQKMVNDILSRIKHLPRVLEYNTRESSADNMTPWTVTYGPGFEDAKVKSKELNESIRLSTSWKEESLSNTPVLKVISKRAPNLKDTLFKRKSIALSTCLLYTSPSPRD